MSDIPFNSPIGPIGLVIKWILGTDRPLGQRMFLITTLGYSANLMLDICHATDKIRKYDPKSIRADEINPSTGSKV